MLFIIVFIKENKSRKLNILKVRKDIASILLNKFLNYVNFVKKWYLVVIYNK